MEISTTVIGNRNSVTREPDQEKVREGMRAEIVDNLSNQDGAIDHAAWVEPIHMGVEG